jgi:DNA-binding response OmpR family regulator
MRVALLEDDPLQAEAVASLLKFGGHACQVFNSGQAMLTRLRQETFDLLVLDWEVPQPSGVEVAAWAREHLNPTPPILMLTARSQDKDVVAGLEAGADDFIVKPVEGPVLLARVKALLRRAYPAEQPSAVEAFGEFAFDGARQTIATGGQDVPVTAKEFALAQLLFRNLNRPLSRAYILEGVWGRNPNVPTRTLDTHVSSIRRKLNLKPELGWNLATVYSYGYRLERVET